MTKLQRLLDQCSRNRGERTRLRRNDVDNIIYLYEEGFRAACIAVWLSVPLPTVHTAITTWGDRMSETQRRPRYRLFPEVAERKKKLVLIGG